MAYTDFLTGVYNRAFMDKKIAELNKTNECIGIIVADIDQFKKINDSYNHAVGDQAIRHFANTLKSYLSREDYLFRSGGEEFTIFLRNRNYEDAVLLAEKIRRGIEGSSFKAEYKEEKISLSYTASFGLFFYKINNQLSIEKAYVYADHLLLKSKKMGKNRLSSSEAQADIYNLKASVFAEV